jgi:hypothetical protein
VSVGGGLSVTSGALGIAILNAPVAAGDTRSGRRSPARTSASRSTSRHPATVVHGKVLVNRAAGLKNGVAATAVNWVTADGANGLVDFTADAGYTSGSGLVDPGKTLAPAVRCRSRCAGRSWPSAGA